MDQERIILHLDMDSFYASVEVRERPEFRNRPVIVGPDPRNGTGRGVVLTCSYEARAFGVRSALPAAQALALCPSAVFIPPHFELYSKASDAVMEMIRSSGFRFQQVSIDEAFLDITPLRTIPRAIDFAGTLQKSIEKEQGLTSSIGIAGNKLVAKIASDFRKPAGLTVVEPHDTTRFLSPLAVRKLPGIGKKAELSLFELGIRTIGELAVFDEQILREKLGKGFAGFLEAARGIDYGEVTERAGPSSVSREITFDRDTDDPDLLFRTMRDLSGDVFARLAGTRCGFRTLTIKVRYRGFVTRTCCRTLPRGTWGKEDLTRTAHVLLQEMIGGGKIRLLGIRLSSLEKQDPRQMRLGV